MDKVIDVICGGGLVIMPTDTIYGILGDATNEQAINNVFELKKRDRNKPLLILVNGIEMLKRYVMDINDLENGLIKKYWPGPLTIIFKKKNINDLLTCGMDTIGIRFPNDERLLELITKLDRPLFSTSVNVSGEANVISLDDACRSILDGVDCVIDEGECNNSSSTIVVVVNGQIKLLREGSIKNISV